MSGIALSASPDVSMRRYSAPIPVAPTWSRILTIAAIVAVLIVGAGDYSWFDRQRDEPPTPPTYLAAAPTTIPGTPSPRPSTAPSQCPLDQPVPVLAGDTAADVSQTVLYVNSSHQLLIHCPEEPVDIVLSENVLAVHATSWPGIVNLDVGTSYEELTSVFRDIASDRWVEMELSPSSHVTGDEWMDGPMLITGQAGEWALLNTTTLERRSLSDIAGIPWPTSSMWIEDSSVTGEVLIVPVVDNPENSGSDGLFAPVAGAPGDILIVNPHFEARWLSFPDEVQAPRNLLVSPDGSMVAIAGGNDQATDTLWLLDASTGDLVNAVQANPGTMWQWTTDSSRLVGAADTQVLTLDPVPDAQPHVIDLGDVHADQLRRTTDPNVVYTMSFIQVASDNPTTSAFAIVDIQSSQVTRIDKQQISWNRDDSPVIMVADPGDPAVVIVLDSQTGKELDRVNREVANGYPARFDSRDHHVVAYSFSESSARISVVTVTESGPTVRNVQSPVDTEALFTLTPDGQTLILSTRRGTDAPAQSWLLDLTDPESEWTTWGAGITVQGIIPAAGD